MGKIEKRYCSSLKDGEKTQAQIHHSTHLYRTHIRRTIRKLELKKLVKYLNPKDRIYKLYVLTKFQSSENAKRLFESQNKN